MSEKTIEKFIEDFLRRSIQNRNSDIIFLAKHILNLKNRIKNLEKELKDSK